MTSTQQPVPPVAPSSERTSLVVIGQGYVGLPLAVRAAECGLRVWGLDTSEEVVAWLSSGRSHVGDVPDPRLAAVVGNGYTATTDATCVARADVVVVCVPTPLHLDGGPDLRFVVAAGETIAAHVAPGTLVVLESTTYPGTTEEVFAPLVLSAGLTLGEDVHIAFSPERIDPGNPVYGVHNTPKVVGGLTQGCTEAAATFYAQLIETVVRAKGAREAELAKLLENTFRHVNIALVNEMVRFSADLDIDLWDAIDCASTKPFGFMAFRPGPGVGGHCIPVDPSYLSHRVRARLGYSFRMVELAEEINSAAPFYVANRVWQALNERKRAVNGSRVLLVGVAYKTDIADTRESPAGPLARRLTAWGAQINYHDPFVRRWELEPGRALSSEVDVYEAAAAADVVVLLQPHSLYDLARLGAVSQLVFDTRAAMPERENILRL